MSRASARMSGVPEVHVGDVARADVPPLDGKETVGEGGQGVTSHGV